MCKCTPNIKTPFCGQLGCEMPRTIGRMISDLERDLEACRAADRMINDWKFLYTMANQDRKYQLLKEMLHIMGFSADEVSKIIHR